MRLIFERSASECDLLVYYADDRLSVHLRTVHEETESYHFEMIWRGEVGGVEEMLKGLIAAEYQENPLIWFGDIALVREGLAKAIAFNRCHAQQTMNLGFSREVA